MATLKELDKSIEANKFLPLYLFTGEERGLITEYMIEIKEKFKSIIETSNIDDVIEDSKYNSLFGGHKLYIMRDCGLFSKKADDKFINFLVKMFKNPTNTCIFIEDKADKTLKQTQSLGTTYIIEFNKLKEDQLIALVTQILATHNKKMLKDLTRYFVDQCDYDYSTIINELTKLINYVDGKQITVDTIRAIVSRSTHAIIFDLMTFIVKQNYDRALDMFDTLILKKESPLVMLSLIYRQLKLLYQVKLLKEEGYNITDIADACDSKPFIIEKTLNLSNFDTIKLLNMMEKCSEYDFKIKTGQIKDTLAIKCLILYSSMQVL